MNTTLLNATFSSFDCGALVSPETRISFEAIPWSPHAAFEGVALKHIVTSAETGGHFSFHLVRIEPGKRIGLHAHERQLETHEVIGGSGVCITQGAQLPYAPGVVALLPAGQTHEIQAGPDGLFLFAKFMPALV